MATDALSNDAVVRVGVFYDRGRVKSKDKEEGAGEEPRDLVEEMKTKYHLDEVYIESEDPENYEFKIRSVSGIDSPGEKPVTWSLIKRNILLNDGDPLTRDIEIFTHTDTVNYTKGEVSVTVSPKTLDLGLHRTAKLTATVRTIPDGIDKSVTWTSDKPEIATVDQE